ncbi:MAG: carboxypeptidase-like regulatory domain-containing protein, partial [Acidobacteriota bacterium]
MKTLSRIALVLIALTATIPVLAQDARGRVQGTISDKNGADIPGVTLTLRNDATGIAVTGQSGDNGRYLFNQIDPGIYTITVQHRGFKSVVQKNIRLHSRGDVTADITLEVSDIAETVTIESGAANVQFNTTNHELTVEQTFFKQLPLATRSPANLIALDPTTNVRGRNSAAVANFDHYALNAFDIGGRSAGANDVLIDGSPLANSSKLGYNPPLDAVAELTVKQNAVDAEFGHSAGGILTISMKSGTNQIHGSAYYFGRNQDWNALSDRTTRQHSRNNFWNGGATVGLPIIKNKLFLFSSYEKQTDTSFRALNYTLPTALERQGDFSQSFNANGSLRVIYDPLTSRIANNVIVRDPFLGNKIPQNRWDPLATRMLANLWSPNNAGDDRTGLNNYKYEDYRYYRYYNVSNRVDWQIKENWKAFGRVSFFRTNQPANDYTNGADKLKMRRTEGS